MKGTTRSSVSAEEEEEVLSESDLEEFSEKCYEEIRLDGNLILGFQGGVIKCPFCKGKKPKDYKYDSLLAHAEGFRRPSDKDIKVRGRHLGMAMFLQKDMATAGESKPLVIFKGREEVFVFPWVGVLVNIDTQSASSLKDVFIERGFNPVKVKPVWDKRGHSGTAIVTFNKGLTGFHNALSFEKAFEADLHGKSQWLAVGEKSSSMYGWVARYDDHARKDPLGEMLRNYGDLKTTAQVEADEQRLQHTLLADLEKRFNKRLDELTETSGEKEPELDGTESGKRKR